MTDDRLFLACSWGDNMITDAGPGRSRQANTARHSLQFSAWPTASGGAAIIDALSSIGLALLREHTGIRVAVVLNGRVT